MWGDRVIVERKEYLEKLIAWKDKKLGLTDTLVTY